jgi:hypothetical protein
MAAVSANASRVVLQPGQFIGAQVADTPRFTRRPPPLGMGSASAVTVIYLPFRYYGIIAGNKEVNLRPTIIRQSALRYRPDEGVFRGSLLVALEDSLEPGVRKVLPGKVRLTFVAQTGSVSPAAIELGFTTDPLTQITVTADQPRDSLQVEVYPQFDLKNGIPVWLRVQPVLAFEGVPRHVAGLGIQTVAFPVRLRGALTSTPVTVTVATDRGVFLDDTVRIGTSGSAKLRLRSAGIGPARITATSLVTDPVEATVQFGWPVTFLLAALLGGAIGGLTAHVNRRGGRKGRTGKALLKGLLIGFVVAVVYYAIDVNLLKLDVTVPFFDEAAVFAFALLGGVFGMRVLEPKSM